MHPAMLAQLKAKLAKKADALEQRVLMNPDRFIVHGSVTGRWTEEQQRNYQLQRSWAENPAITAQVFEELRSRVNRLFPRHILKDFGS